MFHVILPYSQPREPVCKPAKAASPSHRNRQPRSVAGELVCSKVCSKVHPRFLQIRSKHTRFDSLRWQYLRAGASPCRASARIFRFSSGSSGPSAKSSQDPIGFRRLLSENRQVSEPGCPCGIASDCFGIAWPRSFLVLGHLLAASAGSPRSVVEI